MRMRRRSVIAGFAAQTLIPAVAGATARLGVAPTVIDMDTDDVNSLFYVINSGDEALTAQLRLFGWSNDGVEESYTPTTEIAFSPGQFNVPAGGRQIVRLARQTPPGPVERAYRLAVDQLPDPRTTGRLRMTVRMMVPLFVAPAEPTPRAAPILAWTCEVDRASHIATLTANNPGRRRVKLTELTYAAGRAPVAIYAGLAGYALAAGRWSCRFRLIGEPAAIEISALTDDGRIRANVPLTYG